MLHLNRRHFFHACGAGLARIAFTSLDARAAGTRASHFPSKAKSIIYLFMEGGPSQLDLLDYKPKLKQMDGQVVPASLIEGKRFAFMERMAAPKLHSPRVDFRQYGQSGQWVSSRLQEIGAISDKIAIVNSLVTTNVNHSPAMVMMHTGSMVPGRPSLGSWIVYGLGSEAKDLPAFVAMTSGPRGPRNGTDIWGSGFLPTTYQGVPFLNGPSPIFNLDNPPGVSTERQARAIAAIGDLNRRRLDAMGDSEIATRIASYEMAFKMQASCPELMDISKESRQTLDMYGATPGKASFANNCLLARRLVERGVRCVQVYHTDWDHHNNIEKSLDKICPEVDRPSAALVRDLEQRGLLESTVVLWGGEFGRTPMREGGEGAPGRNHQVDAMSVWLAGGGIRAGQTVGKTDELGFRAVEDPVHVHDLHATLLHLFGMNHKELTYRFQGRDFRLTDVEGSVVSKLVS
jgi:hypothetical protein